MRRLRAHHQHPSRAKRRVKCAAHAPSGSIRVTSQRYLQVVELDVECYADRMYRLRTRKRAPRALGRSLSHTSSAQALVSFLLLATAFNIPLELGNSSALLGV